MKDWKSWEKLPNAGAIADGLKRIPQHWSLTPLQDKSPRRENWQSEDFIPHGEIKKLILFGEKKTSSKGNKYTAYASGFGLRTGEFSGGLLAVDIDGTSAEPLLDAISGGNIPKTVGYTSGKPGRKQLLFQIPDEYRKPLKTFTRAALTEWEDLKTACDEEGKPTELLEFRYNRVQSCLPPSRHPQTGSYRWLDAPDDLQVAIAPQWLCDLLLRLASEDVKREQQRKEQAIRAAEIKKGRIKSGSLSLSEFLEFEVLPRLSLDQIFCWSGHNFREFGKTFKGSPPWRQSASGTSFHVWWDGEQWAWQDKATGEGGNPVQYRWKLKGNTGSPKGKDFVEIVKELASEAGLEMPEFEATVKNKSPQIPAQDQPLSNADVLKKIDELLDSGLLDSEIQLQLGVLAKKYDRIFEVYKARLKERTAEEDRLEVNQKMPKLIQCQKASLSPHTLLWGDNGRLADLLLATANGMPTSVEHLITTLIPVCGSLIGANSRIIINPATKYKQPSIFWSAVVASTGRLKTPIQEVIINPLDEMESDAYKAWKQEYDDYQLRVKSCRTNKDSEMPDPPDVRKRYVVQGCTTEALIRIHAENPRGFLQFRDEWSSFINSRNKYRGGKGDDLEIDLSLYNGGALSKDLVSSEKSFYLERSAISRTGNTQPSTLQKLQAEGDFEDAAGEFARWLFCLKSAPVAYINLFADNDKLGEETAIALKTLYKRLSILPSQDYFLEDGAKRVFQQHHHKLTDWSIQESHPGLAATYPKLISYTARLALWVHLVNAVLSNNIPSLFVSAKEMKAACIAIDFFAAQAKLLYAINSTQEELTGNLLKIKEFVDKRPQGVTARDIKCNIRPLRNLSPSEIDKDCQSLIDLGVIEAKAEGRTKKYYSIQTDDTDDKLMTGCHQFQNYTQQGIQPIDDTDDTFFEFSKNQKTSSSGFYIKDDSSDFVSSVSSIDSNVDTASFPADDRVSSVCHQPSSVQSDDQVMTPLSSNDSNPDVANDLVDVSNQKQNNLVSESDDNATSPITLPEEGLIYESGTGWVQQGGVVKTSVSKVECDRTTSRPATATVAYNPNQVDEDHQQIEDTIAKLCKPGIDKAEIERATEKLSIGVQQKLKMQRDRIPAEIWAAVEEHLL